MKLARFMHPDIRHALLVFLAVLLAVGSLVAVSETYMRMDQGEYRKTDMEIRRWKSRIDQANLNNQILVDHEDTFYRLQDMAIIGDENRLSWVETVQRVAEQRGLASVKYNIATQQIDTHDNLKTEFAGIDVFRSVMTLDMKLMHEGDFFTMMNALRKQAKGLFIVDKCDIVLLNQNIEYSAPTQENLSASCELSWYTMKKAMKG